MANDTVDNAGLEKSSDLGTSQQGIARRWKLALKLASKREIKWREKVKQIYEQYVPETAAPNTFNILWSNTETLRPAIYNSLPEPIVRRRYQDEDKLGKAVSQVITRALEFSQDTYDFDAVLRNDVLATLLAGRAVSRVKYIPDLRQVGADENNTGEETQESEAYEEIE